MKAVALFPAYIFIRAVIELSPPGHKCRREDHSMASLVETARASAYVFSFFVYYGVFRLLF